MFDKKSDKKITSAKIRRANFERERMWKRIFWLEDKMDATIKHLKCEYIEERIMRDNYTDLRKKYLRKIKKVK